MRGGEPVRLNEGMVRVLNAQRTDFVVPAVLLDRALHATNMEQATIVLDAFNRERQGYAATRTGHADDPGTRPDVDAKLPEWRVSDEVGRGELSEQIGLPRLPAT